MFEKEYDHDTCDLISDGISNIFKCQTVIPDIESQRTSKYDVGHTFSQSIQLVKPRDHHDLLLQKNTTTDPDVSIKAEVDSIECFEIQRLIKVRNL